MPRDPGPFPLGAQMTTWMVRYDKKGRCVSPLTQKALIASLANDRSQDVILFSHGWKTDFDGAEAHYSEFLKNLEGLQGEDKLPDRKFVFVGITWPSQWFPGTQGPDMAALGDDDTDLAANLAEMGEQLEGAEAAEFYDLASQISLTAEQALHFAELLIKATPQPAAEMADLDDDAALPSSETVVEAWSLVQSAVRADGRATPADFDRIGLATGRGAGAVTADGGFNPLDAVRVFSLYQMKDRAGRVGAGDVATLLHEIAARARAVYAVGHSFGAKVMLSAAKKADLGQGKQVRLLLLQSALSHLAFSKNLLGNGKVAGYADVPDKVARIFTTFSNEDFPLHKIFHLGVIRPDDLGDRDALAPAMAADNPPNRFAAMGGYGPREVAYDQIKLGADEATYGATTKTVVALDGAGLITSHTDVKNKHCARALRFLMD